MARMLDLIRQSQVPANLVRSAAKGALALPAVEMLEVLVFLTASPLFGEQARLTLAGWDEASARQVAGDAAAPPAVLRYFIDPKNLRPALLPTLLENAAVPDEGIAELAHGSTRSTLAALLASERVRHAAAVLHVLETNPALTAAEQEQVRAALAGLGEKPVEVPSDETDEVIAKFLAEHAEEIAREEGKPFELAGDDEVLDANPAAPRPANLDAGSAKAAAARVEATAQPEERKRESVVQKIARLTVGDRVQLAMKGTKDERFVLIRSGSRVVSLAVLESPKLSDAEVETFASMKNVQEDVLRGIARKRRFMKSYAVVRNLVNNPRAPLDLGLGLVAYLLVNDLKSLSMNKNISETVRKVALKMFREKSSGGKKAE